MTSLAITVVGHDRPGIIAAAADALAQCGMNLEDSSMTLLRGHFAMTLVCAGDAPADTVRDALARVTLADMMTAPADAPARTLLADAPYGAMETA